MPVTRVLYGERIGRQASLRTGCSATLYDPTRQRILLTKRSDNGLWCLPGGGCEPGESWAETCVREVAEETGLQVAVVHLLGIYSNPDVIIEYADGGRFQMVVANFEVQQTGGELGTSPEVCEFGFFNAEEIGQMDVMPNHRQRIEDAFHPQPGAYIR